MKWEGRSQSNKHSLFPPPLVCLPGSFCHLLLYKNSQTVSQNISFLPQLLLLVGCLTTATRKVVTVYPGHGHLLAPVCPAVLGFVRRLLCGFCCFGFFLFVCLEWSCLFVIFFLLLKIDIFSYNIFGLWFPSPYSSQFFPTSPPIWAALEVRSHMLL